MAQVQKDIDTLHMDSFYRVLREHNHKDYSLANKEVTFNPRVIHKK